MVPGKTLINYQEARKTLHLGTLMGFFSWGTHFPIALAHWQHPYTSKGQQTGQQQREVHLTWWDVMTSRNYQLAMKKHPSIESIEDYPRFSIMLSSNSWDSWDGPLYAILRGNPTCRIPASKKQEAGSNVRKHPRNISGWESESGTSELLINRKGGLPSRKIGCVESPAAVEFLSWWAKHALRPSI